MSNSDRVPLYRDCRLAELHELIAAGWGETANEAIPADWRSRRGPDVGRVSEVAAQGHRDAFDYRIVKVVQTRTVVS